MGMNIRALILEDDFLACEQLRWLLEQEDDVLLVAEPAQTSPADLLRRNAADVVFLGVPVSGEEGRELRGRLAEPAAPFIVAVAGCAEHALAAFDLHALDCLVKPLVPGRFHRALQRVRHQLAVRGSAAVPALPRRLHASNPDSVRLSRIKVKTANRVFFLPVERIDWVEAANNHVLLHAGGETYQVRETLQDMAAMLGSDRFSRISRSALANVDRVSEVQTLSRGRYLVILQDGSRLPTRLPIRDLEEAITASPLADFSGLSPASSANRLERNPDSARQPEAGAQLFS